MRAAPRRSTASTGKRMRHIEANKEAAVVLSQDPAAALLTRSTARQFLAERGFDAAAAKHFGVGYAPAGWDSLVHASAW